LQIQEGFAKKGKGRNTKRQEASKNLTTVAPDNARPQICMMVPARIVLKTVMETCMQKP
jgi:hypothetical protein